MNPEIIEQHGITPAEYELIKKHLGGRDPNLTELGVFSVMWSEHCSYKNSKLELKKFPTTGERVLVKAGEENAGVIDIGDGWAVAFKIESHNHPSAVDPFNGAATGVGGCVRDIFTMGARPAFAMASLRFGDIRGDDEAARTNRHLFAGATAGIAYYGNGLALPTVGGEVYFDNSYSGNPLVNAFCLGVLRHDQIARGAAAGVGNPVYYVGAPTWLEGLAGASFASRDLSDEVKEAPPTVPVGDPFLEKRLIEACLELLASGCVAGIQDMGAAGLTCSTCETASRGGTGVEIELSRVPKRDPNMTPYETLLSETQERMLVIVQKGNDETVKRIFEKWELPYAEIGVVRDDGMMRVKNNGETVVEIPARALTDEAPLYSLTAAPKPAPHTSDTAALLGNIPAPDAVAIETALLELLAHPSIASKQWAWKQCNITVDQTVLPGSDAAVFTIPEANKILAATTDCNAIYCCQDPRLGARIAVAEAARNLACTGAVPLALTDNLNFGNPHRPENFLQLREAIEGMADACHTYGTPVTGGNVSLYNENPSGAIDPTPTVGMVGLIEKPEHITTQAFKAAGDEIYLLGDLGSEMGATHYLLTRLGEKIGAPPSLDDTKELALHNTLRAAIAAGLICSAHDCAEGGLAVALAESCLSGDLGADTAICVESVESPAPCIYARRPDIALFNESQSRAIVTCTPANAEALIVLATKADVPCTKLGVVTQDSTLRITCCGKTNASWSVPALKEAFCDTIEKLMSTSCSK